MPDDEVLDKNMSEFGVVVVAVDLTHRPHRDTKPMLQTSGTIDPPMEMTLMKTMNLTTTTLQVRKAVA